MYFEQDVRWVFVKHFLYCHFVPSGPKRPQNHGQCKEAQSLIIPPSGSQLSKKSWRLLGVLSHPNAFLRHVHVNLANQGNLTRVLLRELRKYNDFKKNLP
jgi:hypothetical protein